MGSKQRWVFENVMRSLRADVELCESLTGRPGYDLRGTLKCNRDVAAGLLAEALPEEREEFEDLNRRARRFI